MVIGVGNAFRGDDAAGLEVASRLGERVGEGVRVVECEGEPSRLLDAWEGAEEAIVVDAVSSGAAPGTLHHHDALAGPLPVALFQAASTHAVGVGEAVELGRALERLPARLEIYGIEGARFGLGEEMSPEVAGAVAALVDRLARPAR